MMRPFPTPPRNEKVTKSLTKTFPNGKEIMGA